MRLRRQLLLISLLLLSLPWVGCQYLREMESILREGQIKTLEATAKAVARSLEKNVSLPHENFTVAPSYYAHPLPAALLVDGYYSDWLGFSYDRRYITGNPHGSAQTFDVLSYVLGEHGGFLYGHIRVLDSDVRYFNPLATASFDYVTLLLRDEAGMLRDIRISTGAPGVAQVELLSGGQYKREYRIQAVWVDDDIPEGKPGYSIEFRLPFEWVAGGFYLSANESPDLVNSSSNAQGTSIKDKTVGNLYHRTESVSRVLADFSSDDLRLRYVNTSGWILASAGDITLRFENTPITDIDIRTRLYELVIDEEVLTPLSQPEKTGQLVDAIALSSRLSPQFSGWYLLNKNRIGRVLWPVYQTQQATVSPETEAQEGLKGYVVVEQSMTHFSALTNHALSRLLIYSFGGIALGVFVLLLYASWLSFRIRRLNRYAQTSVDQSGKIREIFSAPRSRDELGDLGRSYRQLLIRLDQHSKYLQTLASKLSHELRTPLAIIKSSLDNASILKGDHDEYIQRADEGVKRLSSILNAMGAASRIEESIQTAERESVDVETLFRGVVACYQDVYPQVAVLLTVGSEGVEHKEPSANKFHALVSPDLLVQQLDKLVDNAVSFSADGDSVEVGLSAGEKTIVYTVKNYGPLLEENTVAELFDPLISLRTEKKSDGRDHLGLGLHIARLIAEFHGGNISATNEPYDDVTETDTAEIDVKREPHKKEGVVIFKVTIPK